MARRGTTAVQPRFTGSKSALGIAVLAETASRADRAPRVGALWFLRYGSALIPRSGELCAELDAVATLFAARTSAWTPCRTTPGSRTSRSVPPVSTPG